MRFASIGYGLVSRVLRSGPGFPGFPAPFVPPAQFVLPVQPVILTQSAIPIKFVVLIFSYEISYKAPAGKRNKKTTSVSSSFRIGCQNFKHEVLSNPA